MLHVSASRLSMSPMSPCIVWRSENACISHRYDGALERDINFFVRWCLTCTLLPLLWAWPSICFVVFQYTLRYLFHSSVISSISFRRNSWIMPPRRAWWRGNNRDSRRYGPATSTHHLTHTSPTRLDFVSIHFIAKNLCRKQPKSRWHIAGNSLFTMKNNVNGRAAIIRSANCIPLMKKSTVPNWICLQ